MVTISDLTFGEKVKYKGVVHKMIIQLGKAGTVTQVTFGFFTNNEVL